MKKILLGIVSAAILGHGCKKDELDVPVIDACGVDNPLENPEWLASEVQRRQNDTSPYAVFGYIEQAVYAGETLFILFDCNSAANSAMPILDCSGASIGFLGDENYTLANLTARTVIFRPSDSACNFD